MPWKPQKSSSTAAARPSGCQKNIALKAKKCSYKKVGTTVVLIPYHQPWQVLFDSLDLFSADFMEIRNQPDEQARESLFE